ncbi:MAG: hypothetical protein ACRYGA_12625 [Janthinobacterium lividum]
MNAKATVVGDACADAFAACPCACRRESGALFTHAYDQPEVVAAGGGCGLIGGMAGWFAAPETNSMPSPGTSRNAMSATHRCCPTTR